LTKGRGRDRDRRGGTGTGAEAEKRLMVSHETGGLFVVCVVREMQWCLKEMLCVRTQAAGHSAAAVEEAPGGTG